MSKFGSLTADTEKPHRHYLNDPKTGKPIRLGNSDKGERAYIDILPEGGDAAKAFDREERQRVAEEVAAGNLTQEPDQMVVRQRKAARLTRGWLLIDPDTGEKLDVPCTEDNARELYTSPSLMAQAIWLQAWLGANTTANFITRSAKLSSDAPSTDSNKGGD